MESSLSLISFLIVKFMENWNDIELDEELGMNQMIEDLLQLRNEVLILNDDVVKFLIIHIYLNTSPKFVNKNH